jgi:hypothetical protein
VGDVQNVVDRRVEMRAFAVYRFEEGLIVRREAFTTREQALEAAGLSE